MDSVSYTGLDSFRDVTKNISPEVFWLKPSMNNALNIKKEPVIGSSPETKNSGNSNKLGLSIAGATLFSAALVFFILKGGPINIAKPMERLKNYFESRIQKLKLDVEATPERLALNEFIIRAIDTIKIKSEVVNNFTTLKDYSLKRFMCRRKNCSFSAKIHNKITSVFEKIGKSTVKNSYKKTVLSIKNTIRSLDSVNGRTLWNKDIAPIEINGVSLPKEKWLEVIIQKNRELLGIVNDYFSPKGIQKRYVELKKVTSELEKEFDKKGYFWFLSKDIFKEFVADTRILKDKTNMQNEVLQLRNKLSYSLSDMIKDAQTKIVKITKSVKYNDTDNIRLLREISRGFDSLGTFTNAKEYQKAQEVLLNNLDLLKKSLLKNSNIDKNVISEIDDLCKLPNFKKGKVEEILEIYKALLPKSKYEKIEKLYKESIKNLDCSIKIETVDFVNKLRDLTMGSAPTDIITVLSGFTTLAYFLCKSDNNQQRASVALKYGIPALTFIGTSLFFNAKLFAGSKAMLYGAATTWVVGQIGDIANTLLIHHLKKTGKYIPEKSES